MKQSLLILTLFICILPACQDTIITNREKDFNFEWKFYLGDEEDASTASFDDSGWRDLRLPHDWSVEASFDSVNGEGATAYLPGGIGWYRKHFTIEDPESGVTYIHFDGIYNNSEIWMNGTKLGFHPYGYSPFYFDITDYLRRDGEPNVLAIRVDRTRYVDSRWYTGSGIYRDVKLVQTGKLHIPIWGTFITTPEVSSEKAVVSVETTLKNKYDDTRQFELSTVILGPSGNMVTEISEELSLSENE